jgi:endonuclease/exonuclease/phosphatase family metal-dependent hydrolase
MDPDEQKQHYTLQPGATIPQIAKRELYDRELDFTAVPKHLIKVLTYNIWDRQEYWQERIEHVVRLIKEHGPDVTCLLDVSENCYNYINDQLEKTYIVFQVFLLEGERTGMVLLCKRDTVNLPEGTQPYYYDFNCGIGRVIGVELKLLSNGERLHVLCTKLDDHRDNDHIRSDQFAVVQQVIKKLRNCIVVGDFNIFRDGEEVQHKIMSSKLNDAWTKMGCPNRVKYTFDGKRNHITQDQSQLRASRIYYMGSHLHIKSLGLIGTNYISDRLKVRPSCHYGLIGTFQCEKLTERY